MDHPQQNHSNSIETLESSIQKLITNWKRRQRCVQFFSPCQPSMQEEQALSNRSLWRVKLGEFLESTPVHLLAIALILTDLALTVLDLALPLLSCTTKEEEKKKNKLVHWVEIAILSVLLVKLVGLGVALGRSFFRRVGYMVDVVVLIVALCLELFVEAKGAGLIVVVSLWRVVRVVQSAFELTDEAMQAQMEGILSEFEGLRDENMQLREVIAEKDERIGELEEALAAGCLWM